MEAGKIRLIKSLVSYHATNKYYRDIASMIYVARLASNGKLTPADEDASLFMGRYDVKHPSRRSM
jgi:hypothetical protein